MNIAERRMELFEMLRDKGVVSLTDAAERFGAPRADGSFAFCRTRTAPVVVGDNVWIGGGAIQLPGVTIGSNTVIGAGSVVTRDIPANVVAVGSPCRVLRRNG